MTLVAVAKTLIHMWQLTVEFETTGVGGYLHFPQQTASTIARFALKSTTSFCCHTLQEVFKGIPTDSGALISIKLTQVCYHGVVG